MGSGHVSHRKTSAFFDHFDHSINVFENIQLSFKIEKKKLAFVTTWSTFNNSSTSRFPFFFLQKKWFWELCSGFLRVLGVPVLARVPFLFDSDFSLSDVCVFSEERNTSITKYQRSRGRIPSTWRPASKEITSDSVELWDTDVCFLHIQLMVTNVRLPKIHQIHPEVDLESSRSPAKSESWNKPNRQCWAVFLTWQ